MLLVDFLSKLLYNMYTTQNRGECYGKELYVPKLWICR